MLVYKNSVDRPGLFDLKGKAKWDAWESRKGQDLLLLIFDGLLISQKALWKYQPTSDTHKYWRISGNTQYTIITIINPNQWLCIFDM